MAQYSSSEAIESIRGLDDNVEIRGFVDNVFGRQVVGQTGRRLNVYKFVLNNGAGKRVMCLAWEKEIERVENIVAMNKILHIEAGQAKVITNQRFNLGNASFELTIRGITDIVDQGMREEERMPHVEIPVTAWEDIADREGEMIAVVGWIKCIFKESRHFNNESSFGFGSITDGNTKLEVRLTSLAGLPHELFKGTEVKITGRVNFATYLYLKLDSGSDVVPTEGIPREPGSMLNITMPSTKRQRVE